MKKIKHPARKKTARKTHLAATGKLMRETFKFLKGEHLINASTRLLYKTI